MPQKVSHENSGTAELIKNNKTFLKGGVPSSFKTKIQAFRSTAQLPALLDTQAALISYLFVLQGLPLSIIRGREQRPTNRTYLRSLEILRHELVFERNHRNVGLIFAEVGEKWRWNIKTKRTQRPRSLFFPLSSLFPSQTSFIHIMTFHAFNVFGSAFEIVCTC